MNGLRSITAVTAGLLLAQASVRANSHREAPTSLDRSSAISDFYGFRSDNDASKVTLILRVDAAFDPAVVYSIRVNTASFEFRFSARPTYSVATGQGILAGALNKDKVECLAGGLRVFAGTRDIALEIPASSRVIEAWAAAYRARATVRRTANTAALVEIQRMGNPLADGSEADVLRLDTSVPSGFPNGRRLTDDVMAIALHAPAAAPTKGAYLDTFPYVRAAAPSKAEPPVADGQTALAGNYIQKLRETGDGSYLDRASKILDAVLARDSRNYEALRLRNDIALHLHEFVRAADESRRLAAIKPHDPRNWGTLGDALMETGEYDKAADAYQQMLDLRPGLSSLNRVAFYRFVTGDAEGAIAAMNEAIAAGSRIPENLAWCQVDLGWMYFKTGKIDEAYAAFGNALRVFPGYHRAHAGMGQALAAQGKIGEAIRSYRAAQAVVPMPDYAAALAELYEISGLDGEGKKQQALLDMLDQIGQAKGETTNRNLAVVYADQDRKLDRAMQLAQAEFNSRRDVYSFDALAWALYKNKRFDEAEAASAKALQMKTAEPVFYYHAGMIAAAMNRCDQAKARLNRALALNPKFDPRQSAIAAKTLAGLTR
jgi:tetratricopeptide (TPR) repeat protein